MRKEASISIAYKISDRPYKLDVQTFWKGGAASGGYQLIQAIKHAQSEETAVMVSYFDYDSSENCHISIQHSLIIVDLDPVAV